MSGVAPASGFASRPRAAPGAPPEATMSLCRECRLTLCAPVERVDAKRGPAPHETSRRSAGRRPCFRKEALAPLKDECAARCSVPPRVLRKGRVQGAPAPQTAGAMTHACTPHRCRPRRREPITTARRMGPRLRGATKTNGDPSCHAAPKPVPKNPNPNQNPALPSPSTPMVRPLLPLALLRHTRLSTRPDLQRQCARLFRRIAAGAAGGARLHARL